MWFFWMEKIHNNIAQKFRFTYFASIFNIFSVFLSHTNYQQTTETILINNKTHFHCIVFWCVLQVVVIKFSMILALFAIWISHTIWLKIFILYFMCVFVVNLLYIDKQYQFHSYQKIRVSSSYEWEFILSILFHHFHFIWSKTNKKIGSIRSGWTVTVDWRIWQISKVIALADMSSSLHPLWILCV